jgi:hypothetical protein
MKDMCKDAMRDWMKRSTGFDILGRVILNLAEARGEPVAGLHLRSSFRDIWAVRVQMMRLWHLESASVKEEPGKTTEQQPMSMAREMRRNPQGRMGLRENPDSRM